MYNMNSTPWKAIIGMEAIKKYANPDITHNGYNTLYVMSISSSVLSVKLGIIDNYKMGFPIQLLSSCRSIG